MLTVSHIITSNTDFQRIASFQESGGYLILFNDFDECIAAEEAALLNKQTIRLGWAYLIQTTVQSK